MEKAKITKKSEVFDALKPISKFFERGRFHMDCIFCGKPAKRRQSHFSFAEKGYKCFVCGHSGSLPKLYGLIFKINLGTLENDLTTEVIPQNKAAYTWQNNPKAYLNAFTEDERKYNLWRSYKPLTNESIDTQQLGIGYVPSVGCTHERLIVPLFNTLGDIVGFKGRSLEPECNETCPKWLSAGGSEQILYNADNLFPGCTVLVCESFIDAILISQLDYLPEVITEFYNLLPNMFKKSGDVGLVSVASTGGAGTWKQEWSQLIASYNPVASLIMFDNDLAGTPNARGYQNLVDKWYLENPQATSLPAMNPVKLLTSLRKEKVQAFITPLKSFGKALLPEKFDIGDSIKIV